MTVTDSLQQYLTIYLTYFYKYSMHGIFKHVKYKMLKSALTCTRNNPTKQSACYFSALVWKKDGE